jgi:IS30 family transposase
MKDSNHHTKLTAQERDLIAVWKGGGLSLREIARRLHRSPSTIHDELKRNSFRGTYRTHYVAIHAHAKAVRRAKASRRRQPLKNPVAFAYVVSKLRRSWSPEVIAGRLRKRYGRTILCHETIYRFIYSDHPKARELKLWEYLPRKQKRRRTRDGRQAQRMRIPDRVSVEARPQAANLRLQPGHWEGDTMEGRRRDKDGIQVEVERLARKILASKVNRVAATDTLEAQRRNFAAIPQSLRRSITLDNGRENVKHRKLHALGLTTYFTKGYAAWQKGSVEHAIGLIRRYLPKGTSLTTVTQEELDDIVEEINNRPRKVLNYNTPNEVFQSYLNS